MTIPASEDGIDQYTGNNLDASFDYNFKISDKTDLKITVTDLTGADAVLTVDTDYTVSGVGVETGGSITMLGAYSPLPTGYLITLEDDVDVSQTQPFGNQSSFFARNHESAFDKLTRLVRRALSTASGGIVKFPSTVLAADFDPVIPRNIVGQANITIMTNATGDGFEAGPTIADLDAANAAAAQVALDAAATAADVVQTGLDVVATNADVVQTGLDAAATAADVVSTNADVVQTGLDAAATAADVVSTNADVVQTGLDAAATAADVVTAASTLADFETRYLGSYASDPALDNEGNPLIVGALYWDSTNDLMKSYNGTSWGSFTPTIATQEEAEAGTDNTKFMTPLRSYQAIMEKVSYIAQVSTRNWTSRSTTASSWQSVCWSPDLGLFCAVSGYDHPMTSPDGITWTGRTASEASNWKSVCWSPDLGLFCAVSATGTNRVMTSPDGITWTGRTASEASEWTAVAWSPDLGLFCAVSATGTNRVMTSPDGITWTGRTASAASDWQSVCWSPDLGLFCAVSGYDHPMTSPDGITWTGRTAAAASNWKSVCWSPELGLFCAVSGYGYPMTSPDGITWTGRTASEASNWRSVCWSPELGLFCAVSATGTNRVMTSPDGITWTGRTASEASSWKSVCWSPELGLFSAVALAGTNRAMTSL